jgi:hypothetical protein
MINVTETELAEVLAHLKDIAPKIRQRDIFGGDNRAKIDAQIKVLENPVLWDDDYEFAEDNDLDIEDDSDRDIAYCAGVAINWLKGDYDGEDFKTDWDGLIENV